ncbi:MAG: arginine--tRNA ligase [Candidatus Omnitrophica bacterium]|nr:arginine--tRNA ligase [Candidatus Omnitrophota bacterium]MCM8771220.1 arginine--tRNA ligase [Candidatus Omnitrophota bacterium]
MKKNSINQDLVAAIRRFLKENHRSLRFEEDIDLEAPRLRKFGDLTSHIAFRLAARLKQRPQDIAQQLVNYLNSHINKTKLKDKIEHIKAENNGFINFFLKKEYFYKELAHILTKGSSFGKQDIGKNKAVLIEFVSANPTGPLSIAHARQAAVGDTLARILAFLGFRVKKEYYLNDEGKQIDILGNSIYLRMKELKGEKIEFPPDGYQGEYIYDIAQEILNRQEGLKEGGLEKFSEYGVKYILEGIKKDLKDFDVEFDYWISQKKIRKSGKIRKVLDYLRKKKFIYDKEGAVWFKSTNFGDDKDRVVIKSDGSYTYLAPDIAYHREKYKRRFKWLINLWGPDHHGYINRLKAAVCALGYKKESLSIIIVQLATIYKEGKPLVMSTRRGQLITLREVLDEVGKDASRFFLLMRKTSSHLDFDLTLAKQQTPENPVFYVQYAHARINSILEKSKGEFGLPKDILKEVQKANFHLLKSEEELLLLRTLMQFPLVLKTCYESLEPQGLTVYLGNLAADFHKFYDLYRVLSEDRELTRARLALCLATKMVLANGLRLIGVSAPLEM